MPFEPGARIGARRAMLSLLDVTGSIWMLDHVER
jgi:hypothetical protein